MKLLNKIILSFFIVTIVCFTFDLALTSCIKDEDKKTTNNSSNFLGYLKVTSASYSLNKVIKWGPEPDSLKLNTLILAQRDSIKHDSLGVACRFVGDYVAFSQRLSSSLFISSAYAPPGGNPPNGYNGLKNKLTSIQIISNSDYDATHLAGSSLNDLFDLAYNTVSQVSFVFTTLTDYSNNFPSRANGIHVFKLKTAPTISKYHKFKFTLKFDSGDTFVSELDSVKLY